MVISGSENNDKFFGQGEVEGEKSIQGFLVYRDSSDLIMYSNYSSDRSEQL